MKILKHIFVVVLAVLGLSGCLRDNTDGCAVPADGNIILELHMPDSFKGKTRATLTDDEELAIDWLDVLVFQDNGGGDEVFLYVTDTPEVVSDPVGSSSKAYKVSIRQSETGQKQKLVLLANMRTEVRAALDEIAAGDSKEDVLERIEFAVDTKWASGRALPMWGESPNSIIVTRNTQGGAFGNIGMLYSVARVDVGINANDDWTAFGGVSNFNMMELFLFNVNDKGYAAPDAALWSQGLPTVPADASQTMSHLFPLDGTNTIWSDQSLMRSIYVPETANKSKNYSQVAYMIIAGEYRSPGGVVSGSAQYYRIDFYDRTKNNPSANRLDLLRGHHYKINITGVEGEGDFDMDVAKDRVVTRLTATINVWNEQGVRVDLDSTGDVLEVSQSEFTFSGAERNAASTDNKLTVYTDIPGGWKVKEITDPEHFDISWLNLSQTSGPGGTTSQLYITATAWTMPTPRYGRIVIEAGRWSYVVNVEQRLGKISVSPEVLEINFDYYPVPLEAARVSVDSDCGWMVTDIQYTAGSTTNWLSVFDPDIEDPLNIFDRSYDLNVDDLKFTNEIYLRADANTERYVRAARVYLRNEDGVTAAFNVRQGWIACGAGGVTKTRNVGGTNYQTHIYGTNVRVVGEGMIRVGFFDKLDELYGGSLKDNAINYIKSLPDEYTHSCFMVENYAGGTYERLTNLSNSSVVGPYYTRAQALAACPDGWRLPLEVDANNVQIGAEALLNYGMTYYTPDYLLWGRPADYIGYHYRSGSSLYGSASGTSGYWHGAWTVGTQEGVFYSFRDSSSPADTYVSFSTALPDYYVIGVRCVEDEPVLDYPTFDRD